MRSVCRRNAEGSGIPVIRIKADTRLQVTSGHGGDCGVNNVRMIKRLLTPWMALDWQLTYSVIQRPGEKRRQGSGYKKAPDRDAEILLLGFPFPD